MKQIAAEWILRRPGHEAAMSNGVIDIDADRISGVRASTTIADGRGLLAMPALSNAHDHGRGMSTLLIGAADDALEVWLPALAAHPAVDPYAVNALAFARMARSGCSSILHCHVPQNFNRLPDEAAVVAKAVNDIGIRLGFVVPLRDRNRLVIGDNDAFLAALDAPTRELIVRTWLGPLPDIRRQLEIVDEIGTLQAPHFDVQYGPVSPHWCSDELLAGVAEASARSGRRIHMHLLETRLQREWGNSTYREGLIPHLDGLGLLSPRLTVAHCVWLRPDEMELFAERGVTIAVNTGSNLRLRSGTAPLQYLVEAGLKVAFGMDGLTLDDDADMLRELRLAHLFHAGRGLEAGVPAKRIFDGTLATGHRVAGGREDFGVLEAGRPADIAVLDYDKLTFCGVPGAINESDAILGRASDTHLRRLVVGGRDVVVDGRVIGIDEDALAADIDRSARKNGDRWRDFAPLYRQFQNLVLDHYRNNRHLGSYPLR